MKVFYCALVFCVFTVVSGLAQGSAVKIGRGELPAMAVSYLEQHFPSAKKVKYYREATPHTWFYRTDFKLADKDYSLVFFQSGSIYKTATEVTFQELPTHVQAEIEAELGKMFRNFNIQGCRSLNPDFDLHYKVELKGKNEKGSISYESVFNRNGKLVSIDEKG